MNKQRQDLHQWNQAGQWGARLVCALGLLTVSVPVVSAQQAVVPSDPPVLSQPAPQPVGTLETRLGNPNPKNSGQLFFPADFANPESWTSFSIPAGKPYTAGLDRGVLYLVAPEAFQNVYVFNDLALVAADVRLEAVVENASDVTANNISLVCRANKAGWYEFSINSGGFWHIWKLADGQYTELATGPSRVINQKRGQNQIAATCIGSDLTLYVNYRKIGTVRDRSFQDGGQVGVGLSSFGLKGAAVDIDHFSASLP